MQMIEQTPANGQQTKTPATTKGIKTRQKLLDVAEEVFGTKGYFAASIVDITQQANVAQGTFYNYFSSKYEIFAELIRQLSRDFRIEIKQEIARAKTQREALEIGIHVFLRWVKNHRNLYSIVQQSVLVDEQLYRAYYERLAQGYLKGLEEAMSKGEFKRLHPETVAYCLMGVTSYIGMRWVYWENQDVPDHVVQDAITFIFEGLANHEGKREGGSV
jgi:AcrR family transcriptional regulator